MAPDFHRAKNDVYIQNYTKYTACIKFAIQRIMQNISSPANYPIIYRFGQAASEVSLAPSWRATTKHERMVNDYENCVCDGKSRPLIALIPRDGSELAQKIQANSSLRRDSVEFHWFGCRQNGRIKADTKYSLAVFFSADWFLGCKPAKAREMTRGIIGALRGSMSPSEF